MLIDFFKKFFSKPVSPELPVKLSRKEIIDSIDYGKFQSPEFINNKKQETLLLVDDIEISEFLYKADFDGILSVYKLNVMKEYNYIKALGPECGYSAINFIRNSDILITHAILDLTLGHIEIVSDGTYIEVDGVDIAIELYKHNPDVKILFSTAHSLDNKNSTVKYYFHKLQEATGKSLLDLYLNKNGNRKDSLYKLLKKG